MWKFTFFVVVYPIADAVYLIFIYLLYCPNTHSNFELIVDLLWVALKPATRKFFRGRRPFGIIFSRVSHLTYTDLCTLSLEYFIIVEDVYNCLLPSSWAHLLLFILNCQRTAWRQKGENEKIIPTAIVLTYSLQSAESFLTKNLGQDECHSQKWTTFVDTFTHTEYYNTKKKTVNTKISHIPIDTHIFNVLLLIFFKNYLLWRC